MDQNAAGGCVEILELRQQTVLVVFIEVPGVDTKVRIGGQQLGTTLGDGLCIGGLTKWFLAQPGKPLDDLRAIDATAIPSVV